MTKYLVHWTTQMSFSAELDTEDFNVDSDIDSDGFAEYLEDEAYDTLAELSNERNWVDTSDDVEVMDVE